MKRITVPDQFPHKNNVLCGRDHYASNNEGNLYFRKLVQTFKLDYVLGTKLQKSDYAQIILNEIRQLSPQGRFLKYDPNFLVWRDIGEKKSLDKIKQALREGAPSLRHSLKTQPIYNKTENFNATELTNKGTTLQETAVKSRKRSFHTVLEVEGANLTNVLDEVPPASMSKIQRIESRAPCKKQKFDSSHKATKPRFQNDDTVLNPLHGSRIVPTRYF